MLVEHALIMGPGAGHHRHRWAAAEVVTGQRGQPRRFHDRLFAHRASKSDRSRTTVGRPGTRLVLWGRSCRVETHVHRDEFVTMATCLRRRAAPPCSTRLRTRRGLGRRLGCSGIGRRGLGVGRLSRAEPYSWAATADKVGREASETSRRRRRAGCGGAGRCRRCGC